MSRAMIQIAVACALAAAVVISAVWAVKAKHDARQLFVELEELNRERDRLQIDWGRLQLEQSTLGTHPRVETIARERLGLVSPSGPEVVIVAEPGP